jgi:hypothetical protein
MWLKFVVDYIQTALWKSFCYNFLVGLFLMSNPVVEYSNAHKKDSRETFFLTRGDRVSVGARPGFTPQPWTWPTCSSHSGTAAYSSPNKHLVRLIFIVLLFRITDSFLIKKNWFELNCRWFCCANLKTVFKENIPIGTVICKYVSLWKERGLVIVSPLIPHPPPPPQEEGGVACRTILIT